MTRPPPPPPPPPPQPRSQPAPAAAGLALEIRGLTNAFGGVRAVDDLHLAVPAGSFFGLLGPNGAGKTTTLRMCTGLLRPDAGRVFLAGHDVWEDTVAAKRGIGVLAEDPILFERLTGRELLTYVGLLRGLAEAEVGERTEQLLRVTGLLDADGTLVVDYSQGMRKKVGLAAALIHGPRLLLLDEPFESVDPVSARTLRAILDRHRAQGGTIVFSSHVMELVERLCDHVAIVDQGRVVVAGTLDEVRGGVGLEDRFVQLVGGSDLDDGGLGWLGRESTS